MKKVAHRAALAPPDAGLVGQLFGSALSLLMIPPGGPIEGSDTDAIFSRADYALKAGDIESALSELKALSGVPAQVTECVLSGSGLGRPRRLGCAWMLMRTNWVACCVFAVGTGSRLPSPDLRWSRRPRW